MKWRATEQRTRQGIVTLTRFSKSLVLPFPFMRNVFVQWCEHICSINEGPNARWPCPKKTTRLHAESLGLCGEKWNSFTPPVGILPFWCRTLYFFRNICKTKTSKQCCTRSHLDNKKIKITSVYPSQGHHCCTRWCTVRKEKPEKLVLCCIWQAAMLRRRNKCSVMLDGMGRVQAMYPQRLASQETVLYIVGSCVGPQRQNN